MSNFTKEITDRKEMAEFISFRFGMTLQEAIDHVNEKLGPEEKEEVKSN